MGGWGRGGKRGREGRVRWREVQKKKKGEWGGWGARLPGVRECACRRRVLLAHAHARTRTTLAASAIVWLVEKMGKKKGMGGEEKEVSGHTHTPPPQEAPRFLLVSPPLPSLFSSSLSRAHLSPNRRNGNRLPSHHGRDRPDRDVRQRSLCGGGGAGGGDGMRERKRERGRAQKEKQPIRLSIKSCAFSPLPASPSRARVPASRPDA